MPTTWRLYLRLDHVLLRDNDAKWVFCASESELCECASGKVRGAAWVDVLQVRYGHHTKGWINKKEKVF